MKKINSILHALFDQSLTTANIRRAQYDTDDVDVEDSDHTINATDWSERRNNDGSDEGGENHREDGDK